MYPACGGNSHGKTCEIICRGAEPFTGCADYMFCLTDPYGCSCNTGYRGLSCRPGVDGKLILGYYTITKMYGG